MLRTARASVGAIRRVHTGGCSTVAFSCRQLHSQCRPTQQDNTQHTHAHSPTCTHAHTSMRGLSSSASVVSSSADSTSTPSTSSPPPLPGSVRVRYAPSPTGSMHLGGLRTALYNYLFAHQHHGDHGEVGRFLLRIEDTDQKRLVSEAIEQLQASLSWTGVEYDEGPGKNEQSQCQPYVQSQRLHIYADAIKTLLSTGHAYPCFCTSERLSDLREHQTKKGLPSMYDRLCLGMDAKEREQKLKEYQEKKLPYVVRMKVPSGTTVVKDVIRGTVTFPNKIVDDQILLKSDGFPTYHFACIVDDHQMGITHVIRGEEWLTSTPKHVMLYKMFDWKVPNFAHLPLLLKTDGSKLSKRHADSSLDWYIEQGYLPSAVVNFVAMLGWNPGTTQEVFTLDELVKEFSLQRIQKAGAVVNIDKLNWFNQQHLGLLARDDMPKLVELVRPLLLAHHRPTNGVPTQAKDDDLHDLSFLHRIIHSLASHVTHTKDFVTQSEIYFLKPNYDDINNTILQQLKMKVYPDQKTKELNS